MRHPLTNFEIQKYYQNELEFNGVYSRTNLSKIKDGAYFGSFGLKHIPEKTLKFPKETKISWQVFIEYKHTIL